MKKKHPPSTSTRFLSLNFVTPQNLGFVSFTPKYSKICGFPTLQPPPTIANRHLSFVSLGYNPENLWVLFPLAAPPPTVEYVHASS